MRDRIERAAWFCSLRGAGCSGQRMRTHGCTLVPPGLYVRARGPLCTVDHWAGQEQSREKSADNLALTLPMQGSWMRLCGLSLTRWGNLRKRREARSTRSTLVLEAEHPETAETAASLAESLSCSLTKASVQILQGVIVFATVPRTRSAGARLRVLPVAVVLRCSDCRHSRARVHSWLDSKHAACCQGFAERKQKSSLRTKAVRCGMPMGGRV